MHGVEQFCLNHGIDFRTIASVFPHDVPSAMTVAALAAVHLGAPKVDVVMFAESAGDVPPGFEAAVRVLKDRRVD